MVIWDAIAPVMISYTLKPTLLISIVNTIDTWFYRSPNYIQLSQANSGLLQTISVSVINMEYSNNLTGL